MADVNAEARALLRQFKGDDYIYGVNCFSRVGEQVAALGTRVSVVTSGVGKPWGEALHQATADALAAARVTLAGEPIRGAAPNSPTEDVFRLAEALRAQRPEVVVSVGAGSTIDCTKAAVAYWTLGDQYPDLMEYFGVGSVSAMLAETGRVLVPVVAAQIASGSAAHLTKYSNVTYVESAQKMLIVDDALTPPKAMYDYALSRTAPAELTMDGALDGVAHCLEVYFGISKEHEARTRAVSLLGIELIVNNLKQACEDGEDFDAREKLGLGTDLGGYAIMIGGTNGAHLTSFSLVDILSHGRACALMNPYFTVFFAPAIEARVREVGAIYKAAGYTKTDLHRLHGRDLGVAVAEAMVALSESIGFPTRLADVPGFTQAHIERALAAAKNPKLESKLQNMPVPLSAETVDEYMGPVLEAAKTGDFGEIKTMAA